MKTSAFRPVAALACAAAVVACRGFETIPPLAQAWREVQPQLIGMTADELRQCAGPPRYQDTATSEATRLVYRYADIDNYCEVTLSLDRGKVVSLSARHSAPDLFWLVDGSNYCGQIFKSCLHQAAAAR
jgi:hypothetical protein